MSSSYEVKFVDEDCSGLLPWVEQKAGSKICEALTIGKSSNRGRGLYASQYIQKGQRILMVPSSVQLTANDLPLYIRNVMEYIYGDEEKLAVVIMLEKRLGKYSLWKNYVDCLPIYADMHSSIFWGVKELELLRPSFAYDETCKLNDTIGKQFLSIVKDLAGTPYDHVVTREDWFDFKYCYGLILSRARKNGKGVLCLSPMLDFLNHDGSSTAEIKNAANYSEVRVDRDYNAGDEILIRYDNISNAHLLLYFGIVDPNNAHNSIPFFVSLDRGDRLWDQKFNILNKQVIYKGDNTVSSWNQFNMREVDVNNIHGDGIPTLLRAFFRVCVCDTEEELNALIEIKGVHGRVGGHPLKKLDKEIKAHVRLWFETKKLLMKFERRLRNRDLEGKAIRRQLAKDLLQAEIERKRGQYSEWAPYTSCRPLPDDMHCTLIFRSDEQLKMIQLSCLCKDSQRQKQLVIRDYFDQFPAVFFKAGSTVADFAHAYGLVKIRAWKIEHI